jgi:hypothetical protein
LFHFLLTEYPRLILVRHLWRWRASSSHREDVGLETVFLYPYGGNSRLDANVIPIPKFYTKIMKSAVPKPITAVTYPSPRININLTDTWRIPWWRWSFCAHGLWWISLPTSYGTTGCIYI